MTLAATSGPNSIFDRFAKLNAWMREHLADDLSVARLASEAAMSERNFARAYAGLSFAHFEGAFLNFAGDPGEAAALARRFAEQSL